MSTTTETVGSVRTHSLGVVARRGGAALAVAVVVNLVLTFLAETAAIAPELAHLSYGRIALFTAAGVVGATLVYGALTRTVEDPDRTFTIIAVVVAVLSVVPTALVIPTQPGATTLGTATLAFMHAPPAAASILFLTDALRRRQTEDGR
jgi:hypothetical protein